MIMSMCQSQRALTTHTMLESSHKYSEALLMSDDLINHYNISGLALTEDSENFSRISRIDGFGSIVLLSI